MRVKVDLSGVQKKLDSIANNREVGLFLATTCARYMDQYVPFRKGNLKDHAMTNIPFQVTYETDYAKRVYKAEGITIHTENGHPNATDHWDQAMIVSHEKQIAKEVTRFIERL